jgi:magnesium transporter
MRKVEAASVRALVRAYSGAHPGEVAAALEGSPRDDVIRVLRGLPEREAAEVFGKLGPSAASAALMAMDPVLTRAVASGQNIQRIGGVLRKLDQTARVRVLQNLPPATAARVTAAFQHPPGTAGAYLHAADCGFPGATPVEDVLNQVRERGTEAALENVYTLGMADRLEGFVAVSRLIPAAASTPVSRLAVPPRVTVPPSIPRGQLLNLLDERRLSEVPVVDHAGHFLGIVRQADLLERDEIEARRSMYTSSNPSIEESPDTPAFHAARIRLPWLLAQGIGAALIVFVVDGFAGILERSILLAVLLPLVLVLAQRAGFQAVNVCLDGLSLGAIAPGDWRVQLAKELKLGILAGAVTSALFGAAVYLWTGSQVIALSLAAACAAAIPAAMVAGGLAPLVFLALGQRPAKVAFIAVTTLAGALAALVFLLAASALA